MRLPAFLRSPQLCLLALGLVAQDSSALFDSIQAAVDRKQSQEALLLAEDAVRRYPESSEAWRYLGLARRISGSPDAALSCYDRALALDAHNHRAWNGRGTVKQTLKDLSGALSDMNRALEINPTYHQGYDARSGLKLLMGDLPGAQADANRAIELVPNRPEYFHRRAMVHDLRKDWTAMESDLGKSMQLNPQYWPGFFGRGLARQNKGDHGGAIADFDHCIQGGHRVADALNLRGVSRRAQGHDAEAQGDFEAALKAQPGHSLAAANLRGSAAAAAAPIAGVPPTLPPLSADSISMPPRVDPALFGNTALAGQPAVALEALRALMGPLSPMENKALESGYAEHLQFLTPEAEAYFRELNPKLQESLNLRSAVGQAAQDMEAAWNEAVMAAGYGSETAAQEALAVATGQARIVKGLHTRLQKVAQDVQRLKAPPDPKKAREAARKAHKEAVKQAMRLKKAAQQPSSAAAVVSSAGQGVPKAVWNLVKVEKQSRMTVQIGPEWISSQMDDTRGIARRVASGSFNASDGSVVATAIHELGEFRVVKKSLPTDSRLEWTPPPGTVKAGATWSPGLRASFSADGERMLMKNVNFEIEVSGAPGNIPGYGWNPTWGPNPKPYMLAFPSPRSGFTRFDIIVKASGTTGDASFTYRYEAPLEGAAPPQPPEEVEVVDEYPAEGRIEEIQSEIRFTEGSLQALKVEYDVEKDEERRERIAEQMLAARTSIQRDRDLIESIKTGQPVFTRTEWDERSSRLLVLQMKEEVNRMAELQRNQATALRMAQALNRLADLNPAEATGLKAFVQRQIIESGTAARGDLGKSRQVAEALGNKVLGYWEGESARHEERAIAMEEYAHYATTIRTIATVVVGTMLGEVGVALAAPAWMARAGSALYAGGTGYIEGGPSEALKETVSWAHPLAAVAAQGVAAYQETGTVSGTASGVAQGLAIGWLMGKTTQLTTAAAGKYNYRFSAPKAQGSLSLNIQDYVQSRAFRESAARGRERVGAFEAAQNELKASAQAGRDAATLKRLQDKVNGAANGILEDPHAKFFLLKSGKSNQQTRHLFELHSETTHLRIQRRFEEIMTKELGFNPQQLKAVRNANSTGTAGMDYDLALVEQAAWVKGLDGKLVRNRWLTRNGRPATVSEYQDAASQAYRRAAREAAGIDADHAWENVITSVHPEAYKDVGAARPGVADPSSYLHPKVGSQEFGGWLDLRNLDSVAGLKKAWARQAGDVTEHKGWEFTNSESQRRMGLSPVEGMHEAVRGSAKDLDKVLTLVNQGLGRAQGADAQNLTLCRNHWQGVQELMKDFSAGHIGPVNFRHKLHQMTGRTTVNEVIADIGGGLEAYRKIPPR